MLGRGVHPQALLFDSQPTEVRDDWKAACIQVLRRASAHNYLASSVRMLRRRLEEIPVRAHDKTWPPNGWIDKGENKMTEIRKETDSLGEVDVPADKLWGAQTQRSLEHFSIGNDLMPREWSAGYATVKKAAANATHASKRLDQKRHDLIVQVCDEILAGEHHDMFPLHVWMTGSGTQFNMNVNEVISNRCCQIAGPPLARQEP